MKLRIVVLCAIQTIKGVCKTQVYLTM